MQSLPLNDGDDKWLYSWGSSNFASTKVYKILVHHEDIHIIYKWIWKSHCQPKHRVFFWLLIKDRLSTRNLLRRRNMHFDSYNCVLCNMLVEKSVHHLFVDCSFARMCWDILNTDIPLDDGFPDLSAEMKVQLNTQFFMEAMILLCWTIWTARNELIFKGNSLNLTGCQRIFFSELNLLKHRVKTNQQDQFSSWIKSLAPLHKWFYDGGGRSYLQRQSGNACLQK